MKLYEVKLKLPVKKSRAKAYKKLIEDEQGRYWTQNPITENGVTTNTAIPVWAGNTVSVTIRRNWIVDECWLDIVMISRTQPNLECAVDDYCRMGATVVNRNF